MEVLKSLNNQIASPQFSVSATIRTMGTSSDSIRDLGPAERLRLVEQIGDDLAVEPSPIPLPDWAVAEAKRRRAEMLADSRLGFKHDEVWKRIDDSRNG